MRAITSAPWIVRCIVARCWPIASVILYFREEVRGLESGTVRRVLEVSRIRAPLLLQASFRKGRQRI